MRRLLTASAAIVLAGLAGCKATPPGKLETKTMTFIKHHITIGNKKEIAMVSILVERSHATAKEPYLSFDSALAPRRIGDGPPSEIVIRL